MILSNVLRLRSFQIVHETSNTSESKLRLKGFGMVVLVFCHHSDRQKPSGGAKCCILTLDSSLCQTSRVNTQEANKWSVVLSC